MGSQDGLDAGCCSEHAQHPEHLCDELIGQRCVGVAEDSSKDRVVGPKGGDRPRHRPYDCTEGAEADRPDDQPSCIKSPGKARCTRQQPTGGCWTGSLDEQTCAEVTVHQEQLGEGKEANARSSKHRQDLEPGVGIGRDFFRPSERGEPVEPVQRGGIADCSESECDTKDDERDGVR